MKTDYDVNSKNSMERPFIVEQGRQIPVQCPEISEPAIYSCPDSATLSVFCQAEPGVIAKYLEYTPFEYVSDNFIVYITDMIYCQFEQGGFMDMGIIIPVKYDGIYGGTVLFEYENSEHGICAGRELWGYPKKYADASIEEREGKIIGSAYKHGVEIIHLELDLGIPEQEMFPSTAFKPHLQLHTIPAPDGPYIFSQRVLMRDTSPDFIQNRLVHGAGSCTLRGVARNPLDEFNPIKIYGASYETGDFYSTNEHGWAKVLKDIILPGEGE